MKESNIQRLIMLALSEAGCIVWRNNTGVLKNEAGIPIRFGLCVGSSDLVGIAPNGAFLAVEIKASRGRVSADQQRFIETVNRRGGIAGVCRSVDDALDLIRRVEQ